MVVEKRNCVMQLSYACRFGFTAMGFQAALISRCDSSVINKAANLLIRFILLGRGGYSRCNQYHIDRPASNNFAMPY